MKAAITTMGRGVRSSSTPRKRRGKGVAERKITLAARRSCLDDDRGAEHDAVLGREREGRRQEERHLYVAPTSPESQVAW